MTSILEKNTVPIDDDDDDWEPGLAIPVEDDPTITAADLERFRQASERIKNGHYIELTFKQLRALTEVFDNK
jgi:class 3 adenylate cyclase